ncbi:MAG TPA: ABC transporter ATP-binding protein [Anaerolineales bacterium]
MSFSDPVIEVKNLGKSYHIYKRPQDRLKQSVLPRLQQIIGSTPKRYFHEFWALRDVSFEVHKGETIGIIGRNGSGKSTLLQLICGTLSPTTGTIRTDGRIAALLELGSGFNPEFTGRENVYLNGAILGLSKEEIDARFDDIAGFADIGEFIEQPVKIYSSGMVVRLAFSVQAMVDPDILVVDEALAVGDEKFQRKCFTRLEELKSRGTSILFVSHSGVQVVELCDKALLLERGGRLLYTRPLQAVRAYQKLIYAPAEEQARLTREYQAADRSDRDVTALRQVEYKSVGTSDEVDEAAFDPGLIPETTEEYPVQGAEIVSFQIRDLDGRKINILTPGQECQIEVRGRFLSANDKIYFGLHIRSISGTVITGQRHPEHGKFLERIVHAGENFCITYGFKMSLVPGVYFVGGGIWSFNEPNCLHRILDALMFRITPAKELNALGSVDTSSMQPRLEITHHSDETLVRLDEGKSS